MRLDVILLLLRHVLEDVLGNDVLAIVSAENTRNIMEHRRRKFDASSPGEKAKAIRARGRIVGVSDGPSNMPSPYLETKSGSSEGILWRPICFVVLQPLVQERFIDAVGSENLGPMPAELSGHVAAIGEYLPTLVHNS